MAIVRLHNDDWGYESNCFVCEQRNEHGMRVPFFHDTDRDVVTAQIQLPDHYSGAPTLIHGGVILALLDEGMAWACIAIAKRWAVTTETSTRFDRPVRVDVPYEIVAEITDVGEDQIRTTASVLDQRGRPRATAQASFTILGEAQIIKLAGGDITVST
jgi:acyl-coenzyme A thioesterase PaaI-like protein